MGTIKVVCHRTGKKFAIETEVTQGKEVVVNFVDLKEEEYNALPLVQSDLKFETSSHILPCNTCHTRSIASCTCNMRNYVCSKNSSYSYQCLYCKELKTERTGKDIRNLKIYVSSSYYDNIGQVLTKMGLKWTLFTGRYDCDILFLNCGTSDNFTNHQLKEFVNNGGILYASDWASRYILQSFPNLLTISDSNEKMTVRARIHDSEIREMLGSTIDVCFDLGGWHKITSTTGTILLSADNNNGYSNKQYSGFPIMISKNVGQGVVYYTSFHNHSQASEKETKLLELLLLKQIGHATKQSVADMTKLLGLNLKLE